MLTRTESFNDCSGGTADLLKDYRFPPQVSKSVVTPTEYDNDSTSPVISPQSSTNEPFSSANSAQSSPGTPISSQKSHKRSYSVVSGSGSDEDYFDHFGKDYQKRVSEEEIKDRPLKTVDFNNTVLVKKRLNDDDKPRTTSTGYQIIYRIDSPTDTVVDLDEILVHSG
ncbi:DEKNAAC102763 [Brettanomyces naardenensis]|uniref:DEKNAAC102763 n=1 Tax=Brettanomyces naardenensis TaxID=13370 RepID=A0A448YL18_BRENA|nr:DEKNAAC102763 [Brettanomyces naardenensis]